MVGSPSGRCRGPGWFLRDTVRKNSVVTFALNKLHLTLAKVSLYDPIMPAGVALDLSAAQYLGAANVSTHNDEYR
jgi:hypothetical protein